MVKKGTCAFLHRCMRQSRNREKLFSQNNKPSKRDIRRTAAPPKNGKPFFPKTRNPVFGTVACGFRPFLQYGAILTFFMLNYLRPYMLSRKWLQKSSANYLVTRGFAQKGFAISIFGHFFCPFPENFIESCRVKTKNNKINLQTLL